ncbi:MAG TPA: 2-amino-4-hydroxy-6-hydroxymethyldihydropteridine diphosphokinase [Thermoanaerobaculia bacterium]|jgi:2-amino-4-hydroxy-6-hydroxymethyldihydropteridine diphosphokinase
MSTSSRTTSTSSTDAPTERVVIALGSNLGDRALHLRRAVHALGTFVRVVRVSSIYETDPVDAPSGSPPFFNMVIAGATALTPHALMHALLDVERKDGRHRRGIRNAPRTIDLDLIFYGAHVIRTASLVVPHPRYRDREFVMAPLRELGLRWVDPVSGQPLR